MEHRDVGVQPVSISVLTRAAVLFEPVSPAARPGWAESAAAAVSPERRDE
jgi:hypothetical protein